MAFGNFGLDQEILLGVEKAGYTQPTPVQEAAIPVVLKGGDLTAIAQTGTGKTAAFVLPILQRLADLNREGRLTGGIHALILAPTRELSMQIKDSVRTYGAQLPIRVASIHGGVEEETQIKSLRKGVQVLVATPGRLIDLIGKQHLDFSALQTLVLDEADRMLDMGFLRDIETIVDALPHRRQTLMFSATFPRQVESLALRFQHRAQMIEIGDRSNPADTVTQIVYEVQPHLKAPMLLELLRGPAFKRVLIFARMKDGANRIAEVLRDARISSARLHSSRTQEQREKALQDFKDGKVRVLVATDIVARGIDIDDVSHVINYDFPVNPEDYIHRIGRTGRAEHTGQAISFVPRGDLNLLNITELAIGRRIDRKRLKNFDYTVRTQPAAKDAPPAPPEKRDWRKRTREMEAKRDGKQKPALGKANQPPPSTRPKREARPPAAAKPTSTGKPTTEGKPAPFDKSSAENKTPFSKPKSKGKPKPGGKSASKGKPKSGAKSASKGKPKAKK